MRLFRLVIAAACAAATLALPAISATPATAATAAPPQTVPALRQWTAGAGAFTFTATTRIAVDPSYSTQLADEAATFADDLGTLEGRTVQVVTGTASPGDIALTLGDALLPAEGYRMTVGGRLASIDWSRRVDQMATVLARLNAGGSA